METPASENGAKQPIAVFLLDDHEVVRRGVRDMLEAEGDIKVVGEAGTASSALARIPALRPDVAVLDVRLPDGDGVTVCREIRSRMPEVACLMLTSFADDAVPASPITLMSGSASSRSRTPRRTTSWSSRRNTAIGSLASSPDPAPLTGLVTVTPDIREGPLGPSVISTLGTPSAPG